MQLVAALEGPLTKDLETVATLELNRGPQAYQWVALVLVLARA